jgi:dienelactone hydrolase
LGCDKEEKSGKLTAGYGYGYGNAAQIGPELTFGIYMQEFVKEPILIIKTAWGGKSLCIDFRPPSAGPYQVGKETREDRLKRGDDVAKIEEKRRERSGHYYRLMMGHVKKVLADIKQVYPGYDPAQGFEVAGFVWFQGCQDFGDTTTYPNAGKPGGYDEYSRLLACLIRDVRKELNAPNMRAVIGVMGINGSLDGERPRVIAAKHVPWLREFRKAMAAPAELPEFKGNVADVLTERFWDPKLEELQHRMGRLADKKQVLTRYRGAKQRQMRERFKAEIFTAEELEMLKTGISNAAYHYMGSAKIFAGIGKGFAEAMAGVPVSGFVYADSAKGEQASLPGEQFVYAKKFYMYRDGKNCIVVPHKVAPGKPWVWRARFFGVAPGFDIAMLEKGYHLVYCDVAGLLGNPTAVERWNKYYRFLTEEHGFAKKPVLEGFSRGGLIIYSWAIANPHKVAAIYGDAAVMNLRSWPGFESKLLQQAYTLRTEQELIAYKGDPIDNLKPLADAKIPIIHVVGDKDKAVPVAANTAIAEKRYKEMGGVFEVIHKKEGRHHPHSLEDPTAIVAFIEKHVENKQR